MPRWSRYPGRFTLILFCASAAFLLIEAINGRLWLNDFRVYYEASSAVLRDETPYGIAHGLSSGYFKYAPVMAVVFAPMAALPYPLAAGLQFALIVMAFHGALLIADRIVRNHVFPGKAEHYAPLFLATLAAGAHLHRELHLGNINVMLLFLLMAGLAALLSDRRRLAGLLWGAVILAKPHFVVLLPWLMVRSEWRVLGWVAISLLIGLLVPLPLFGFDRWWQLHQAWLHAMSAHNAALVYSGGDAYQMVDTAYSFVHRASGRLLGLSPNGTVMLVLAITAAAMGALILRNRWKEALRSRPSHLAQEAFILIALVPSLTVTDTNHFLFALPLMLFLLHRLLPSPQPRWLPFAAIPVLLAHGGNWSDALGPLSDRLIHCGVLGIANLALVAVGWILLHVGLNPGTATVSNRSLP